MNRGTSRSGLALSTSVILLFFLLLENAFAHNCPTGRFFHPHNSGCSCPAGQAVEVRASDHTAICLPASNNACPLSRIFNLNQLTAGCRCPRGQERFVLGNGRASCWRQRVLCPNGKFSARLWCDCPVGSKRIITGVLRQNAHCAGGRVATCPIGITFSTTRINRGCSCPAGTRKDYHGPFKSRARCKSALNTNTGARGGNASGTGRNGSNGRVIIRQR